MSSKATPAAGGGTNKAQHQGLAGGKHTAALSDESSVRELVDTCLSNDDVTPLLRLLFSSAPAPSQSGTSIQAGQYDGMPAAAAAGRPALLDGKPPLEVVQRCLRAVASEQEDIILNVCHSNALEIAQCVAEMDLMAVSVSQLKGTMATSGEALQAAGSSVATAACDLHALLAAQQHLASALGALHLVRRLLQRCAQVGVLLAARQLFAALVLLQEVQAQDLGPVLDMLSGLSPATATDGAAMLAGSTAVVSLAMSAGAGVTATGAGGGRKSASAAKLSAFLQGLVGDLEAAVEYYAVAEFNNWLVSVRSEAKQIGLRAIRKAAIERQLDEDLAKERRQVAGQLMAPAPATTTSNGATPGAGSQGVAAVAALTMSSHFRQDLMREGSGLLAAAERTAPKGVSTAARSSRASTQGAASSSNGVGQVPTTQPAAPLTQQELAALAPGQPLAAMQALLARHRAAAASLVLPPCSLNDWTVPLMLGISMQGLYRCIHVHRALGRLPKLRTYYLQQRRLQVTTDLAPPANYLEAYQGHLAQVAGFFVVEATVRARAPDLLPADAGSLLWDVAAAGLRTVLGRALEDINSGGGGGGAPAPITLLLKDFVLLVCNALAGVGFSVTPIMEVLMSRRVRYHELLTASVALRVGHALAGDSMVRLTVATQGQAEELFRGLGLPVVVEGAQAPGPGQLPLPLLAPFTSCLPRIITAIHSFVSDSLAFLRGLLSSWELLPAVLQARDKIITKTVVDAMADHITRLLMQPPPAWRAREVMHAIANAWALAQAMEALDTWTLLQVRPLGAMAAAATAAAAAAASGPEGQAAAGAAVAVVGGAATAARARANLKAAAAQASGLAAAGGADNMSSTGGSSVAASLRSLQDGGERGLLRLVAGRVERMVQEGAKALNWLPTVPVPDGTSPYILELLSMLQELFEEGAAVMPRSSFLFLARGVVRAMGHAIMRLLTQEGVRAFNLYAMQRLVEDCAAVEAFANACPVPNLVQEFAEPLQLCALLLSPKVEDVLIPEVRRQRYPALDLAGLVLVLERYREQAKIGGTKERTGHVTKRTLDGISKQLRQQMVADTAISGPRALEDI